MAAKSWFSFQKDIVFDSKTATDADVQELRRRIGIVFQDFKLLPDRNVFENVALALRITGTPPKQLNAKVFDALSLVGISQKRLSMPYTLSGGEQQRVAIARAMVHNPYLILADEPTGNLDPENAREVFDIFKEINAGNDGSHGDAQSGFLHEQPVSPLDAFARRAAKSGRPLTGAHL